MKTFLFPLFVFLGFCAVTVRAQDATALPFAVTLGGEAAVLAEGEAFAKVAQPVANDAAIELGVGDEGMIIINIHAVDANGELAEGAAPAVILLQGKNKGTLDGTMDRQKLEPGRYLFSAVAEGKTASVLFEVE